MKINLDLHIHSKYSAATSEKMDLPTIAEEAKKKGISIVGTGDCLHPKWLAEIGSLPKEGDLFSLKGISFLITTEVEDPSQVHHLILVPEISKAEELREAFASHSANLDSDGRPNLTLSAPEIAEIVLEADCLLGPSHAFTPWTGIYAHHRSLQDCYGEMAERIAFVELGLSADSDYADRITELHSRTFLSNSDAHSPWSNKLGREFNQLDLESRSFQEVAWGIRREHGRHPTLNVGFYPEEGKYNRTACTRCYRQFTKDEMDQLLGRCPCGGTIKMGVRDRVEMLADLPEAVHPPHRPPYLHLIPLAEIIAMALGHKSIFTAGVQKRWNELIAEGSEIQVLVDADLSRLNAEDRVVQAIQAFRSGKVEITPGGGGRYGSVKLPEKFMTEEEGSKAIPAASGHQRSLFDF